MTRWYLMYLCRYVWQFLVDVWVCYRMIKQRDRDIAAGRLCPHGFTPTNCLVCYDITKGERRHAGETEAP